MGTRHPAKIQGFLDYVLRTPLGMTLLGWSENEPATDNLQLFLRPGETDAGQDGLIDLDEDSVASGENDALRRENFCLMEELASFPAEMPAGQDEGPEERDGLEVVDFHMASDCEDIERAIELAHRLVKQSCHDTAVDIAGRAFVKPIQLKVCGGYRVAGILCVRGEGEMKSLRILRPAPEAVIGSLINGGSAIHRDGGVAGCVRRIHS